MLELGRKLRIYLAEKNKRKKDFAIEVQASCQTVSNWLHNDMKPHFKHAIAIVDCTEGCITLEDCGHE